MTHSGRRWGLRLLAVLGLLAGAIGFVLLLIHDPDRADWRAAPAASPLPAPRSGAAHRSPGDLGPAVYAAHPDADEVMRSAAFADWVRHLAPEPQVTVGKVLQGGTPAEYVLMLGAYKSASRQPAPRGPGTATFESERQLEAARLYAQVNQIKAKAFADHPYLASASGERVWQRILERQAALVSEGMEPAAALARAVASLAPVQGR
ncbi:MAG: hypothetical protein KF686_16635 [Ramlibacter sp.]|nr:hypothetical protein [Ramlibacter sp.]